MALPDIRKLVALNLADFTTVTLIFMANFYHTQYNPYKLVIRICTNILQIDSIPYYLRYYIQVMKLDLQFLAQNSRKMMQAGGYYSLFITAENHKIA